MRLDGVVAGAEDILRVGKMLDGNGQPFIRSISPEQKGRVLEDFRHDDADDSCNENSHIGHSLVHALLAGIKLLNILEIHAAAFEGKRNQNHAQPVKPGIEKVAKEILNKIHHKVSHRISLQKTAGTAFRLFYSKAGRSFSAPADQSASTLIISAPRGERNI